MEESRKRKREVLENIVVGIVKHPEVNGFREYAGWIKYDVFNDVLNSIIKWGKRALEEEGLGQQDGFKIYKSSIEYTINRCPYYLARVYKRAMRRASKKGRVSPEAIEYSNYLRLYSNWIASGEFDSESRLRVNNKRIEDIIVDIDEKRWQ